MEIGLPTTGITLPTAGARRSLAAALALGVLADLLLRSLPWGINAPLWGAAFVGAAIGIGAARRPLFAALAFALVFAWRSSPSLLALCGMAALGAAAIALLERPARSGFVSYAIAGFATAAGIGVGAGAALHVALPGAPGSAVWRPIRAIVLGGLLAAPLLLVFGALFATADPMFADAAQDLVRALDDVIEHGGTIFLAAWLAAGALVVLGHLRVGPSVGVPSPRRGGDEVLIALFLVDALFAAFLVIQARALLGGSAIVEATIGLSYAEYARHGFFQLVACVAIALPALLVADWAVPPGAGRRRRFVLAGGALLLMVMAVLASAASRMGFYVDAYGLTELRLLTSVFMAWLAIAGLLVAVTVLRGRRAAFPIAAIAAAAFLLAGVVILSPDSTIVRYNATHPPSTGFDVHYATSLSADAVPALLSLLPALGPGGRCIVAQSLLSRWGAARDDGWRTWNLSRTRARRSIDEERARLEALARPCGPQPSRSRQA